MTDAPATPRSPEAERRWGHDVEEQFEKVWAKPTGLAYLSAVNNSVIGRRFIITAFLFFLAGGVLALLMRTQLIVPENDFLSPEVYNQLFTMHGTTMMFLFAVPIMEAFGVYLIPGMIGCRDLAFPRLSAYGYWCFLFGGILLFSGFLIGAAPDGGWFMYVPLTSKEFSPGMNQDFWLLGVTFVEIASIAGALELIVTILKLRAPGMSLDRMPIFAWYMLAVSFMIIIGFPPLVLGSILLEAERAFDLPFYDVARGGDPLLWQHLFWIFGHPEVYIIFLPAAGLVSAMLPSLARNRLVGYHFLVLAVVGTAFLSFGLWVHHMYATGISRMALSFFAGASLAVSIPSGIQVFAWIATLWTGRPKLQTPLLFIVGFIIIFVIGGLTGVMIAMFPFDWQVHDTYFVVAHFHYVLIGGMVFPLFAALTYYLPRATGRMLSETGGKVSFWLMFIGFNVTFLPMHLTGLVGMPRRVFTYPGSIGWDWLNFISTVGSYVFAAGVLVFIANFLWHLGRGKPAPINPWNSGTLDWAIEVPTPPYNLRSIPHVASPEPLWDQNGLLESIRDGQEYLATAPEGRRETLATSMIEGRPDHVVRLPHPTYLPLLAALATAVAFVGVLLAVYEAAAAGGAAFLAILGFWLWEAAPEATEKAVGNGLRLPIEAGGHRATGWLGAVLFVVVSSVIFTSLIYSFFYLWTSNDVWPPLGYRIALGVPEVAVGVLLAFALAGTYATDWSERIGHRSGVRLGLGFTIIAFGGLLAAEIIAYQTLPFDVSGHAYTALIGAFGLCHALHVALALGATIFALGAQLFAGVSPRRHLSRQIATLFSYYTIGQGGIVFIVIYYSANAFG